MRYETPAAFRKALETRLNAEAAGRSTLLFRLRKIVTFERLLARLQAPGDDHWILKGGFAMQLRLGARSRTTRDIDLGVNLGERMDHTPSRGEIGDLLGESAVRAAGDFFEFQVGMSREVALEAGPVRAYRYPVIGMLDGRPFETFSLDAAVGDPLVGPPVMLRGSGRLDFAELPSPTFRAISNAQQFAEKLHALTRKWEGAEKSRIRDLVDLMLLLDAGLPDFSATKEAVRQIFKARATHSIPTQLDDPPERWSAGYPTLAGEVELRERTLEDAMRRLREYRKELAWQEK